MREKNSLASLQWIGKKSLLHANIPLVLASSHAALIFSLSNPAYNQQANSNITAVHRQMQ